VTEFWILLDDGGGGYKRNYKTWKVPVKSLPPTNQHPAFTGQMPFLLHNQHCQSTEGRCRILMARNLESLI